MCLLGIDIGTTHIKVGLFQLDGKLTKLAIRKNQSYQGNDGHYFYSPEEIWSKVVKAIQEVLESGQFKIASIGITSMAESGLLINPNTGQYQSDIIPWFDRRTEKIAEFIENEINPIDQFIKKGIRNNYKNGLAKLLWLKQNNSNSLTDAKWLSTSDFIAYKLTGQIGTDYSLAARTFAFRIDNRKWDDTLIDHLNLNKSLFPEASPSGKRLGEVNHNELQIVGIDMGTPVAVSGHDHVCAALAVGAVEEGVVSDSIGTAETVVGCLPERTLTEQDYYSGFNFGAHVLPERFFWMGSIQSSGGSVEWIRDKLSRNSLSYKEIQTLLDCTPNEPTEILYFPYLAGSGSPEADSKAKGALIGLTSSHQKGDIIRAILEGTAYEFEYIRRTIEKLNIAKISTLIATGGGTNNIHWMQIKADVSNFPIIVPSTNESTLLGAALIAGLGCGVYKDEAELLSVINHGKSYQVTPNDKNYQIYRRLFEEGYLPLQRPMRAFYHQEFNKNM